MCPLPLPWGGFALLGCESPPPVFLLRTCTSSSSFSSSSSSSRSTSLTLHPPPTPSFLFSPHQVAAPAFGPVKTHELLHHMTGKGLSAKYHFPRQLCLYQPGMVAVQVTLTNHSDHSLEQIHIGERSPAGLDIHCFNTVGEYRQSKVCPTIRLISAVGCWDSGNHQTFF